MLFQFQALAYNAYLFLVMIIILMKELQTLSYKYKAAGQKQLLAELLYKLFKIISWPLPYRHMENFKVIALVDSIKTA